jgi:hypothetical protein
MSSELQHDRVRLLQVASAQEEAAGMALQEGATTIVAGPLEKAVQLPDSSVASATLRSAEAAT